MAITDDFQTLAKKLRDPLRAWFVSGPPEAWHEVGAAGEPAFQNSWVNYGGDWPTAGFYKDPFGEVHLKGLIKSGTVGAVAFTLPAGYRPSQNRMFVVISNGAIGRVDIFYTTGEVYISAGSNVYLSLDVPPFRAA